MNQRLIFLFALGTAALLAPLPAGAQSSELQPSPIRSQDRLTVNDALVPVEPRPRTMTRSAPVAQLGPPSFDSYGPSQDAASNPPTLPAVPNTQPFSTSSPSTWGTTVPPPPGGVGAGGYPPAPYPQQPPVLFPNASSTMFPNGVGVPGGWPQAQPGPYMRLFQDVRLTYTWVNGGSGSDKMGTNDVELGTTINFPNFLWSGQPLHLSPVFAFHFWDGPVTSATFPTTMPSRVYSAYVESRWQPMLTPMFGGDIDVSLGVFSDFGKVSSDSFRMQGTGVFVLALTPTLALKGGVTYLDRVDLKLLPAGGLVWTPNPQTRFDMIFPKPKLAQYLTTVGNTDVWWYLNSEYGGGSWTVGRPGVVDDRRVDINDIRIGGGFEWTGHTGVRGFVEAAYVFNRELFFASSLGPPPHSLKDSVMVRGGLSY